jgi:hypothetical protein
LTSTSESPGVTRNLRDQVVGDDERRRLLAQHPLDLVQLDDPEDRPSSSHVDLECARVLEHVDDLLERASPDTG